MFTELFPILTTRDMPRALGFYRDALGGRVTHEFPGPDGEPAYVGIDIGASHMGLRLETAAADTSPTSVWIYAEDCEAALERLRGTGARIVEEPQERPLGERVARVLDPDGNEIMIGQRGGGAAADSLGASLLSPEPAKYMRLEYERRFLVSPRAQWRERVEAYSKSFEDIYIRRTHLRLRTLSDSSTGQEFIKLTKKLESPSAYVQMSSSVPLSPMEYEFLAGMPGDRIRKVRYYHFHAGNVFSIDVFAGELAGLVLCEVEAGDMEALMRIEAPDYVAMEVTEDRFFTGGNLSRTSRDALARRLAEMEIG